MTMPKFEPVAYMQLSVEEGVDTYFPRLHKPEKYNKDWWRFDPLHSADQLTEAYEAGERDAIPEGWVLVPKEPNYFELQEVSEVYVLDYNKFCAAYKEAILRMLAAAPKGEEL